MKTTKNNLNAMKSEMLEVWITKGQLIFEDMCEEIYMNNEFVSKNFTDVKDLELYILN